MRLALAAVVALGVVAAACGGVERKHNLSEAVAKTEQAGSARFEFRGSRTEGSQPATMECTGAVDCGRSRLRGTCELGGDGTMEWISIGRTTYMRGTAVFAYGLAGEGWIKTDDDEFAGQVSPQQLLAMLRGASRETERVGEEDVRGVTTARYRLEVDCDEAQLSCDATTSVRVWIDEDGLVRRISYDLGTEEATLEFFDFGAEVDIRPPAPGDVRGLDDRSGTQPCAAGVGSPISDDRLLEAFRAHGFAGANSGTRCTKPVEAVLSVTETERTNEPVVVSCLVLARRLPDAPGTTERSDQAFQLANVQCTAFVTNPGAAADAAIERVDDVFEELERTLRP